ncbi:MULTISPECIES: ribosomal-processing cysteine protease Prp [unclassified Virgibacillus]|uniref:ribosomal-processing cysteine protease Prp n=1 Tax=unclassified Virgibacillus TaxID=2620237 RepID=UPI0024DE8596|nr:ribosomal-processing cysteine protease Prp [Virgibacillus sp. LDC-1]
MIHVSIFRKDNQIRGFELSGHADSGPYGYDLVCAAVSAVSFGAANAVEELCNIDEKDIKVKQGGKGGFLHIMLPIDLDDDTAKKASLLLEGMVVSLKTIEKEYSKYIKIKN